MNIRKRINDALPTLRTIASLVAGRVINLAVGIFIFLFGWTVVMNIGYAVIGARECREAFSTVYPQLSQNSVETDNLRTRTLDDHWISALVMQPKNIKQDEYTIICHFVEDSHNIDEIEIADGNQIDRIKKISDSNFHPKTWDFTSLKKLQW